MRALLCDLRGQLGVHASAIALDGRAVLFVGPSGAGKSTAAAEMCLRHGAELLADDIASLEFDGAGVRVLPCEEDHWLARDSCLALGIPFRRGGNGGEKLGLRAPNIARQTRPLALVVALRFELSTAAAALRPLRGGDAARSLLEAAIRFDVEDAAARQREFEQVTTMYEHARFLELVRSPASPGGIAPLVLGALGGREP